MGNICRSPTAEAVLRTALAKAGVRGIAVDSAGTHGYHAGEPPDRRAIQAAKGRSYDLTSLRARALVREDFDRYGWIFAMDRANLRHLDEMRPDDHEGHVGLYLEVLPSLGIDEMPDPYYGNLQGFERVLDLSEQVTPVLVASLARTMRT